MLRYAFLLAAVLGTAAVHAAPPATYAQQIEHWRAQRQKNLTAPYGWFSLVGLDWLHKGVNTVGSARDNDIRIASAPAHLATIDWRKDGSVSLLLDKRARAGILGTDARRASMTNGKPVVRFGTTQFFLIERDGRKGLRVMDSRSPNRAHFAGLAYFPIDPSLRITARWIAFKPPHKLTMGNEIGGTYTMPVPGKAVFDYKGRTYSLEPVIEVPGAKQYFLVFADKTSGKESYGAARFLDVDPPKPGQHTVVLDFNRAVNPPCAYTPYATCPLPPPQNRLGFRVTAGEKNYPGTPR